MSQVITQVILDNGIMSVSTLIHVTVDAGAESVTCYRVIINNEFSDNDHLPHLALDGYDCLLPLVLEVTHPGLQDHSGQI